MFDYYLTNDEIAKMKRWQNITISDLKEEVINQFELIPTDHHKSFNGRCKVVETRSRIYLLSYSTLVCCWDRNTNKFIRLWDDYSATTMRHINSFMRYLGFNLGGKAWWCSLRYGVEYGYLEMVNVI